MTQKFTAEEKAKECEREAKMRRHVYPVRVSEKKMSQADADRKIAMMDEMAADYHVLADKDRLL